MDLAAIVTECILDFALGSTDEVSVVKQSRCSECGGQRFWMQVSEEEGVANRTCTTCKRAVFIGDSSEHWADADVGDATCPCGKKIFQIAVGYNLTEVGEVRWMYVGAVCVACETAGTYTDWSIDYEPSKVLLDQA